MSNRYKLKIRPNPNSDAPIEEYEFVVRDIANTITDKIHDLKKGSVIIDSGALVFYSSIDKDGIKSLLKSTFSHHFDILRFVGISQC